MLFQDIVRVLAALDQKTAGLIVPSPTTSNGTTTTVVDTKLGRGSRDANFYDGCTVYITSGTRIGDIAKYPDRRENEKQAALARRDMRWDDLSKYLLFPDRAEEIRNSRMPAKEDTCTMCGDFCAMRKGMEIFKKDISGDKVSPATGTDG